MNASDGDQVHLAAEKYVRFLRDNLPGVYNGLVQNLIVTPARNAQALGFVLNADEIDVSGGLTPLIENMVAPTIDYASASTGSGQGFFSGLVNSMSDLLSSAGVGRLLQVAQPFINNKVQQQALNTQVQQLRYGLPITIAGTNVPMPTQPLPIVGASALGRVSNYLPYILLFGGGYLLLKLLKPGK